LNRVAALGAALTAALAVTGASAPPPQAPRVAPRALPVLPELREGDVVLIGVDGAFWAEMASGFSRPDRRNGHAGIVVRGVDGALGIVHAGGSPVEGAAKVRWVSLGEFTAEADRVDILRPRDAKLATRSAAIAASYQGLTFDSDFTLDTPERLYCTELIWRAMSAAKGADIVPEKTLVLEKAYITLEALEANPALEEIAFVMR
jgi:Permuted papain-like amidase enzyme, YaeF/YiiX, C92 family